MSLPEKNDLWTKTDTIPALREGDLQIWRIDLNGEEGGALLGRAFEALSTEERQRAGKMRAGTAPEEFIAGRGSLRRLLGASLNCDPRAIELVLGTHRKPALRPLRGVRLPQFNVSHSHGMVLIALSRVGAVGIDVEYMNSAVETIDVARAAFHPDDLRKVERARTVEDRLLAFYGCWTRREAVAKADGRGLTLPASGFATGSHDDLEQRVEVSGDSTIASTNHYASRYFVRNLWVGSCHLGGVAVARSCTQPTLLDGSVCHKPARAGTSPFRNRSSDAITVCTQPPITFFSDEANLSGD